MNCKRIADSGSVSELLSRTACSNWFGNVKGSEVFNCAANDTGRELLSVRNGV